MKHGSCLEIHEFVHDMRRVSASYKSPHIATNFHVLCHQSFGQNCSTSSARHVHDIHSEISIGSCDPLRVHTTLVRSTICVREPHDIPASFLRVLASLYEFHTIACESLRFNTIYNDMLRHLHEISTTMYESSSTFHDITRFLHDFWCILK